MSTLSSSHNGVIIWQGDLTYSCPIIEERGSSHCPQPLWRRSGCKVFLSSYRHRNTRRHTEYIYTNLHSIYIHTVYIYKPTHTVYIYIHTQYIYTHKPLEIIYNTVLNLQKHLNSTLCAAHSPSVRVNPLSWHVRSLHSETHITASSRWGAAVQQHLFNSGTQKGRRRTKGRARGRKRGREKEEREGLRKYERKGEGKVLRK